MASQTRAQAQQNNPTALEKRQDQAGPGEWSQDKADVGAPNPPLFARGAIGVLLLADGRFPAGSYAHSHGLEEACRSGRVSDIDDVAAFARGLLSTSVATAASLAACANRLCGELASASGAQSRDPATRWALLDTEASARMPSPAQRLTSRRLGRQLWRTARGFPGWADKLSASHFAPGAEGAHQCIVAGVVAFAAAGAPRDAALLACYGTVSAVCHAGIRLLGLDPISSTAVIQSLAGQLDQVADAASAITEAADIPAGSAPLGEHYAEAHVIREGALFAS